MATKVKGNTAKLINRGCAINDEIKELGEELKEIKAKLTKLEKGTYATAAGSVLSVSVTEKFEDISPAKVEEELKKIRQGRKFFDCIKIQITPLKKILPSDVIKKLKGNATGFIHRLTFK
jgi:hypothetical protein